jgi:hypothetical protein
VLDPAIRRTAFRSLISVALQAVDSGSGGVVIMAIVASVAAFLAGRAYEKRPNAFDG